MSRVDLKSVNPGLIMTPYSGSVFPRDYGLAKSQPTPLPVFLATFLDPLPADTVSALSPNSSTSPDP